MIPIVDYADRAEHLEAVLGRSASFSPEVDATVRDILDAVQQRGDAAALDFTERFDGVRPNPVKVPVPELEAAADAMDDELRRIIDTAEGNIRRYHARQVQQSWFMDDGDGVLLGQRVVPMERVGLYVPGGTAFYPSSLLMNAIPAQVGARIPS